MLNRTVPTAIISLMALLPGCGGSAGPSPAILGDPVTYVLRTVAGDPVPAVALDNEHATIVAVADTIRFYLGGSGVQVAVEESTDKGNGAQPVIRRDERPFSYETAADHIEVSFECNDVIIRSCVAPPHFIGTLTDAVLIFESALYLRVPLEYERVRP